MEYGWSFERIIERCMDLKQHEIIVRYDVHKVLHRALFRHHIQHVKLIVDPKHRAIVAHEFLVVVVGVFERL